MLSCLIIKKTHYFSHILHYYSTSLTSLTQTHRLVPFFDYASAYETQNAF